jgi:hypothetical protein
MPTPPYFGLFNVPDGVDTSGKIVYAGQLASTNTENLQYMVSKLLSSDGPTQGQGGTLQFPSAGEFLPYQFNGPITIGPDDEDPPVTQPWSIIFVGTGQGQITFPLLQQTVGEDLFVVQNVTSVGSADIGGVVFQDLMIGYAEDISGQIAGVHVEGIVGGGSSQNVRLLRVTLVNCPIGVWFENSLGCSMVDCNVFNGSTEGTALQIDSFDSPATLQSGIETYIAGCIFECAGGAIGTGTAVQIYGCEHLRMINTRLDSYGQGIVITAAAQSEYTAANVRKLYFGNVSCYPSNAGAALVIQSGSSAAPVTEVWFANCEFAPASSTTTYTGAGIIIQPGSMGPVNQIRFVDCYCCFWTGPGMQIAGGQNIEILGGHYSCNGAAAGSEPYAQSGIAITGAVNGLRITGTACNNSAYNLDSSPPGFAPATQLYGVYVGYGAENVRVLSCDLTGNNDNGAVIAGSSGTPSNIFFKHCDFTGATSPISVTTPVSNLQVTDCPGYNDQGAVLTTTPPGHLTVFTSSTLGPSPHYYGPVVFYVNGVTSVHIGANVLPITSGSFSLPYGVSASLVYTGTPTFVAMGQ